MRFSKPPPGFTAFSSLTPIAQAQVRRAALRHVAFWKQCVATAAGASIPLGVFMAVDWQGLAHHVPLPAILIPFSFLLITFSICTMVLRMAFLKLIAPHLVEALIQAGYCAYCGYYLKGNTSGRCPECGGAA